MIHEETVAPATLDLIRRISQDQRLQDFVLVGGTALALQLGHRRSVDIDLFAGKDIDVEGITRHLENAYKADIVKTTGNGIFGILEDVKTSLIAHKYPMISPVVETDGIRMASLDEIGAMKMHAIVNSGQRAKDFVDMYYLLEHRSLDDLTRAYAAKYPDKNATIARNGLLYQRDAKKDTTALELLRRPLNWREITSRITKAVASPTEIFKESIGKAKKVGEDGLSGELLKKRKGKRL